MLLLACVGWTQAGRCSRGQWTECKRRACSACPIPMRPARRRHRGKAGTGYQHKGTGKGVLRTGCGRTVTSLYALRRPPGASGSTVARPVNGPWPAALPGAGRRPCITCTGRMACQCKAYISIQLILYVPRMQMQGLHFVAFPSLVTLTYVLLFRETVKQRPAAGKATALPKVAKLLRRTHLHPWMQR